MAKSRKKNKAIARSIAQERIGYLFSLAKSEFSEKPEMSKRYVALARKIGMRHRVSIPSELKRSFCKNCGSLLLPGKNSRVRLNDGTIIITCLDCGSIKRYPFDKEKKD
ncbi:ribonuclease P protein component 4 [Methanolobus vulcani]|uniref:Ribonuclease P protein component 4 n=1 Tax=Methanolobus vulcani TaxID=38026 RepID=A0A7Z8KR86_9EURY|nr:ribonuclease P protein component 4 [Methanolobus vulcani]TQD28207.1 ribonuclease P [Methanolobus vulcani]